MQELALSKFLKDFFLMFHFRRATAVVMTGSELESMKMQDVKDLLNNYEEFVFGRLNATQKIKLVESLKRNKEVVAVTGNSGEHAKAMRKSDIGTDSIR